MKRILIGAHRLIRFLKSEIVSEVGCSDGTLSLGGLQSWRSEDVLGVAVLTRSGFVGVCAGRRKALQGGREGRACLLGEYGIARSSVSFVDYGVCEQSWSVFQPSRDIPLLFPSCLSPRQGKTHTHTHVAGRLVCVPPAVRSSMLV